MTITLRLEEEHLIRLFADGTGQECYNDWLKADSSFHWRLQNGVLEQQSWYWTPFPEPVQAAYQKWLCGVILS